MAVRARSLCRWFSSASPTLPYAGNVVSATFPPPIPSPKPTHRPPATISISVLQTGLSSGGQRSSLQPVWERGDLGCGLGRGSRASMNKLQLQHCTFPPVRANVSLFLSAMAQSKCILTADLCPYQHSSAPSLVGLTCQNHTGASGLCVSISGRGAQWHHKSTVQIYLYSVSPAVKTAWGLPIVPSPQVYLKKVMCKGHGSWFCCSGSWCHCPPLACGMNVHHRCQTKVANLCGINQKLMAEALAMIESTQQVCDKFLQFQLSKDYSSPFAR